MRGPIFASKIVKFSPSRPEIRPKGPKRALKRVWRGDRWGPFRRSRSGHLGPILSLLVGPAWANLLRLEAHPRPFLSPSLHSPSCTHTDFAMASYTAELDRPNNIVIVVVTEDDGSDHDYQFDFDPRSGRWEFSERDLLERDFGEDWVEELEEEVESLIQEALNHDDQDTDEEDE